MDKFFKKFITVCIILALFIFIISLSFLAIVQDIKKLEIQLEVANRLGFNIDTDKIYFGAIPPGNEGTKRILIENKEFKKSIVRIKIFGELKDWITVSDNNFILEKKESAILKLSLKVPKNAKLRDYKSQLVIFMTRI